MESRIVWGIDSSVWVATIAAIGGAGTAVLAVWAKARYENRKLPKDRVEEAFDQWELLLQRSQDDNTNLRTRLMESESIIDRQQDDIDKMRENIHKLREELSKSKSDYDELQRQFAVFKQQYEAST